MLPKSLFLTRQATLDDAASIAAISVQAWQESYTGILDQTVLDSLSAERRVAGSVKFFLENPKGQFVACVGGVIVGFCDAGPTGTNQINLEIIKGEIYAIYVLNSYKGTGVGYGLFATAVSYLQTQELCPFIAWVLTDNKQARTFYERQGGEICDTGAYTVDDKTYPEVCYRFE